MEEIVALKSENERLNKIVTILIDQISVLKSENEALRKHFGIKNSLFANDSFDNGTKNSFSANDDLNNGTNNLISAIDYFDKGTNKENSAVDDFDNGTNKEFSAIDEINNGTKSNKSQLAQNLAGNENKIHKSDVIVPHPIEINRANVSSLVVGLRGIFHRNAKRQKLRHVAAELLLLHNNGSATSKELSRIAGLSRWGYAKHAPSVRSKNLIYRHSHQKYMLTEKSKDIIKSVFGR